jgi:hypothetical protein
LERRIGGFSATYICPRGPADDAVNLGVQLTTKLVHLEKIYHTRDSSDYERTNIDESLGERWFCTEAQAIAAGWRARR